MKKLVIFDLDGTLFDTTRAMQACGNSALATLGLDGFEREDYARFSGGGVEEYVNAILEAAGDEEHRHFQHFWSTYLSVSETIPEDYNRPYPEIPQLLEDLKKEGIAIAVLSNKDHASCVEIVEKKFGQGTFSLIRGDKGDAPVKPDPAGALALLKEGGFTAEEALFVGDTQVDVLTGKNAGIETCAVLWGYRTREILEKEKPDHIISSPFEILSLCK